MKGNTTSNTNSSTHSTSSNENAIQPSQQFDCSIDANVNENSYSCCSSSSSPSSPSTSSSLSSVEESLFDQLTVMLQQEESGTYNCTDYISFLENSNVNDLHRATDESIQIDVDCRNKMTQWCFQVIDFAQFKRSTVSIAMSYLDRFLSSHETSVDAKRALSCRKYYQLACMTCLYMAIKMNEKSHSSSSSNKSRSYSEFFINGRVFSDLSRNAYNTNDIMNMERKVLNTLQWRLNGPTSLEFLRYLLQVAVLPKLHEEHDNKEPLPTDNRNSSDNGHDDITATLLNVVDLCGFQLDLAVSDYFFVTQKKSTIAIAALLNALEANIVSITGPKRPGTGVDSMNEASKGNHDHESADFLTLVMKELTLVTNINVFGLEIQESQKKLRVLLTNSGVKYQAQKQPKRGRRHHRRHQHDLDRRPTIQQTRKFVKGNVTIHATTTKSSNIRRTAATTTTNNKAVPLSTIDVQIASSPICVSRVSRVVSRDAIAPSTTMTTIKNKIRRTIIHRSSAFQDSFQSQPQPRLQRHQYNS